jgi:hypothetical protein
MVAAPRESRRSTFASRPFRIARLSRQCVNAIYRARWTDVISTTSGFAMWPPTVQIFASNTWSVRAT